MMREVVADVLSFSSESVGGGGVVGEGEVSFEHE